jgi:hypothetical protein
VSRRVDWGTVGAGAAVYFVSGLAAIPLPLPALAGEAVGIALIGYGLTGTRPKPIRPILDPIVGPPRK